MCTYCDLEIDHLLCKRRHLIIETESVLPDTLSREYEVALALLASFRNNIIARSDNGVIDIERTAGLNLDNKQESTT